MLVGWCRCCCGSMCYVYVHVACVGRGAVGVFSRAAGCNDVDDVVSCFVAYGVDVVAVVIVMHTDVIG